MTTPRVGLALSSGSARGWAHIGVIRALADRGLSPSVVTGASVGALVGAGYASGTLDPLQEWVCKLTQLDVWRLVDATFRGGGVMTGNRLMAAVAECVTDRPIEGLPLAYGAVATDLYTGDEVWLREGSLIGAVRASSGLPGLLAPTWYQDRWLIDGGVVNPLPVSMCRALGADIVIAVDLSRSVTRAAGRLDDLEHWVCKLTQRDVWRLVDTTFRGGGVMTGSRLMEAIAAQIGDAPIESLPVTFGAVATDLYTGEEVWLRDGPYMTAVRASSGVPGLFAPTWHQDRWLIDGGVVNPVPVSLCRALGADIVIAVDLSRSVTKAAMRASDQVPQVEPDGAVTAEGSAMLKKWSGLVDGLVESFRSKRPEPGLLEVMSGAVTIMQDRITRSRFALDPADLVLRPDLGGFQLMDFHRAREAIEIGTAEIERSAAQLAQLATDLQLRRPG